MDKRERKVFPQNLTTKFIDSKRAKKPAPAGQRREFADAQVPGLRLRITDKGHRSWVFYRHYPGAHPSRRALGGVWSPPRLPKGSQAPPLPPLEVRAGQLTLEEARRRAREWLGWIGRGVDPKIEEARQRAATLRRQAATWANVVGDYLEQHCAGLVKAGEAKAILEKELGKRWDARPITDITGLEVAEAIKAIVKRGARAQARNAFGWVAGLYSWAAGVGIYGVEASPTALLKPSKLIGPKVPRDRVLTDEELRLVWQVCGSLGFPYGDLFRVLLLTGQRKLEIGEASWSEINLEKGLLVIPKERMKADRPHEVPLVGEALDIIKRLDDLRRNPKKPEKGSKEPLLIWDKGDFIFSTTRGKTPCNGYSKAKQRLDEGIARLRAEARAGKGAEIEDGDAIPPFVLHDLRRTARTHFSALPVEDMIRELTIAHARPSLHKTYDQFSYRAEKTRLLDLWNSRFKSIVAPPPPTVASLDDAREAKAKRGKRGADQ